jgi:hypothetical protein
MAKADEKPRVPSALRQLLNGYVNTCRVMTKLWFRAMVVLLVALPLGIYGTDKSWVEAAVSGIGLWILVGAISRFLVFEFRQLRAGWVARTIERRTPRDHPSREAVVDWIKGHNDGNYLNTVLKKLGVPPWAAHPGTAPRSELEKFAAKVLGGGSFATQPDNVQTHVYTTTQTQMLNEDGEWVTVQSSTSSDGAGASPSEAIQKALAMLGQGASEGVVLPEEEVAEPPPGFKPIPLSPAGSDASRKRGEDSRRKSRRLAYMPLQLDHYDPHEEEDDAETDPSNCSTGDRSA